MSILVQCDQCGIKRKVNERLAGRTIRCPGCDQPLTITRATRSPELAEDSVAANEASLPAEAILYAEPVEADVDDPWEQPMEVVPTRMLESDASFGSNGDRGGSNGDRGGSVTAAATAVVSTVPTPTGVAPRVNTPIDEPKTMRDDDDDEFVPPRTKRDDGELDMTPMVDVTFLLLIFFMVTASFSLQKSIQVPRQSSDLPSMSNVEEESEELDPIELEINEMGAFLVLAPEWERETPGKQNLITALKEAIGANKDGMKLDIKVHENANLQMLVDGMDAGTIAGFTQIQVTEVDGFD